MQELKLKILIVDPQTSSARMLADGLRRIHRDVAIVHHVQTIHEAKVQLASNDINTIFIDPISLGIEIGGEFIFETRKLLPHIVFVLFLDLEMIGSEVVNFYKGERRRFRHYYTFGKNTPAALFEETLTMMIRSCQNYLALTATEQSVRLVENQLSILENSLLPDVVNVPLEILREIQEQLAFIRSQQQRDQTDVKPGSVFLSYRFVENDYIDGLRMLLERDGFTIITGQDTNTYISQAVLQRIKMCEFFVCLMTKAEEKKDGSYTTSSWLLEEKGAALALNKKIVLLVEEGVQDIGGLQGDWQRIYFTPKSFTRAVIKAIDQLKSYSI